MSNVLAIAQKELRSYFASPIGYVIVGLFALLFGWFFYNYLGYFVRSSEQMMQGGRHAERQPAHDRAAAAELGRDHPVRDADDHDAHLLGREALGHDRAAAHVAAHRRSRSSSASSSGRWGSTPRCSA